MGLSDKDLLARWVTGRDPEAFASIVRRHSGMVYHTCRRILGNTADAEEVTQECFLRLVERAKSVRMSVGGWLHTLATRRSLNRVRGNVTRRAREARYAAESPKEPDAGWDEVQRFVDEAIAGLPDKLQGPVVLHFLEGQTHAQIAESLGLPRTTVSSRLRKGVDLVRKALQKRGVSVSGGALVALLVAQPVEAAPPGITAALGRLALAGTAAAPATVAGVGAAIGGVVMVKKLVLGAAAVAACLLGALIVLHEPSQPDAPEKIGTEPVSVAQRVATPAVTGPPLTPVVVGGRTGTEAGARTVVPKGSYLLAGVVVDEGGSPAASIVVKLSLESFPPYLEGKHGRFRTETTADEMGRFEFSDMPGGRYVAWACTSDSLAVERVRTYTTEDLAPHDIKLVLKPCGNIAGRVRNEAGEPVRGATLYPDTGDSRLWRTYPYSWTFQEVTDDEGLFFFGHLWLVPWRFTVQAEGYATLITDEISVGEQHAQFILTRGVRATGTLFNKETGRGAPDIAVTVLSKQVWLDEFHETTDDAGRFVLGGVLPGEYEAWVMDDTYVFAPQPAQFSIPEGVTHHEFDLAVVRGGLIAGQVRSARRDTGIAGIRVTASLTRVRRPELSKWHGTTDASGHYRIGGLPAGNYMVTRGEVTGHGSPLRDLVTVSVKPSQQVDNVDFLLEGGLRIGGFVVDGEGNPIPGATVEATTGNHFPESVTGADGSFELFGFELSDDPARRTVHLRAKADGMAGPVVGPLELTEAGLDGVVLTLEPAGLLAGQLVDRDGIPVPYAGLRARATSRGFAFCSFGEGACTTDGEGQFELTGLSAATYGLFYHEPEAPITVTNPLKYVSLGPGEEVRGITLVLGDIDESVGHTVFGRVTTSAGRGVAGAFVHALLQERPRSHHYLGYAQSGPSGNYRLAGLPEGTIGLAASRQREGGGAGDRVEVTVPTRGPVNLVLREQVRGSIEGRVVHATTRQPIRSFYVWHLKGAQEKWDAHVGRCLVAIEMARRVQDPEGRFRLDDVGVGVVTVVVWQFPRRGLAPGFTTVTVPESGGPVRNLLIMLSPEARIEGRVADFGGNPVSMALVGLGGAGSEADFAGLYVAHQALTGPDGSFVLTEVPQGHHMVTAFREGFAPAFVEVAAEAGKTSRAEIVLGRGGVIEGTLTFDGAPVAGGTVTVSYPEQGDFGRRRASTDSDGVYRVEELPAGPAEVSAWTHREEGSTWLRVTREIVVGEGQVTVADLHREMGTGAFTGTVTGLGEPFDGFYVDVIVERDGALQRNWLSVGEGNGFYVDAIPSGTASITVSVRLEDGAGLERQLTVDFGDGETVERTVDFGG